MSDQEQRLFRLCGNPKNEKGGGLPLPQIFHGVLDHLLDNGGEGDIKDLCQNVKRCAGKEERVEKVYKETSGDSYLRMVEDAIDQLCDCGFVEKKPNQKVSLSRKFAVGKSLLIVPKNEKLKHGEISCTVFGSEVRKAIGFRARQNLEIKAVANKLRPEGSGLRPPKQTVLNELRKAVDEYGQDFFEQFPILVDQDGRILDGRHRFTVAQERGIELTKKMKIIVHVEDDYEAVAIAVSSNRGLPWAKGDLEKISNALGITGTRVEDYRSKIGRKNLMLSRKLEAEQLWQRGRGLMQKEIASRLGVTQGMVSRYLRDLLPEKADSNKSSEQTEKRGRGRPRKEASSNGATPKTKETAPSNGAAEPTTKTAVTSPSKPTEAPDNGAIEPTEEVEQEESKKYETPEAQAYAAPVVEGRMTEAEACRIYNVKRGPLREAVAYGRGLRKGFSQGYEAGQKGRIQTIA